MKKLLLTTAAVLGLAGVAFGQGTVRLANNTLAVVGVQDTSPGNWYDDGPFHLEVWALNSGAVPGGINGMAPLQAYAALAANGFVLQTPVAFSSVMDAASAGVFNFGVVTFPTANAPSAVLALVGWSGNHATWASAAADPTAVGGVVAFVNPLAPTTEPAPPPAELTGWDSSGNQLFMTQIVPEPSTLTLAGLGAVALLGLRRRK